MEKYITPEVEIIKFDAEDVITTSSWKNGEDANDFGGDGDIKF